MNTCLKQLLILFAMVVGIISLAACDFQGDVPVQLVYRDSTDPLFGMQMAEVQITAVANEVRVESLVLNRGNCHFRTRNLPRTLRFGETVGIYAPGCFSLKEVTVETSLGEYTYTFER